MSEPVHDVTYDSPVSQSPSASAIPTAQSVSEPLPEQSTDSLGIPHRASAEASTDSLAIGPILDSNDASADDHSYANGDMKTPTAQIGRFTYTSDGTTKPTAQSADEESDGHDVEVESPEAASEESGEGSDDSEEEDSDDGSEEEEEPVLKYEKIAGKAAEILEKDNASAIAVGETYFAIGTHLGLIHLFSLTGTLLKSYRPHSASITDICICTPSSSPLPTQPSGAANAASFLPLPTNLASLPSLPAGIPGIPGFGGEKADSAVGEGVISDLIGTVSLDGQAMIHSIATGTTTGHNFRRPLRSIALEPTYASSQSKAYVCGGLAGDLVLSSKSTLSLGGFENVFSLGGNLNLGGLGSGQSQRTIHSGEGPIWTVRWKGEIIAWANDAGVRLWHVGRGERIAFIEREVNSPRADLFRCSLHWVDESNLVIGWADLLKIVHISTRLKPAPPPGKEGALSGMGSLGIGLGGMAPNPGTEVVCEVEKVLRLDCMISGVVPWPFVDESDDKILVEEVAGKAGLATAAATVPLAVNTIVSANEPHLATRPGTPSTSRSTRPSTPSLPPPSAPPSSFLILAYLPTKSHLNDEAVSRADQKRMNANPPELRIISSNGEELSSDVLGVKGFERWGAGDYGIVESFPPISTKPATLTGSQRGKKMKGKAKLRERDHGGWLVLTPKGIVWVKKRDRRDRVTWLVERERYEEAMGEMEKMERDGEISKGGKEGSEGETMSKEEIGRMYLGHLFKQRQYEKAAKLCPKVLGADAKAWEDWIFQFAHAEELSVLVPYVPFKTPRLGKVAYGIILAYYLNHDTPALSQAIKTWPSEIYDIPSLINAIPQPPPTVILMECLADLYIKNRQPGKALPYFLRLRRPNVFQLIRDNNLFTDVQDQALLLVEFDQELLTQREHLAANAPPPSEKTTTTTAPSTSGGVFGALRTGLAAAVPGARKATAGIVAPKAALSQTRPGMVPGVTSFWQSSPDSSTPEQRRKARGDAIPLLVEYSHSIPIAKVVNQLEGRPYFLYLYLDALFERDPELSSNYVGRLVELYAEFAPGRVIRLLQTAQNLLIPLEFEKIYKVCEGKDMVPEMVWVRSRMGDNKGALFLIIDRLQDVDRAIDFAKERKDDDLWEDLLRYSETRPPFIKGLLENVSTEIDPIRIIRRIRNGLEIPGLKESLIKILHDFNLQTSLMEGCGSILESDVAAFANRLQRAQVGGIPGNAASHCPICHKPLHQADQDLILVFLCGHLVHAHCTSGGAGLPKQPDSSLVGIGLGTGRDLGAKIAYAEMVKRRLDHGCPVHERLEQGVSSSSSAPLLPHHHSHSRHRA